VQTASVSNSSFNGSQQVIAIPSPTTFQYNQTGPNTSSGNGVVQLLIKGDVFTDNVLLNHANKAYRKVQNRLLAAGSPSLKTEAIITLPSTPGQLDLTDISFPQLPVDFMGPRIIEERTPSIGQVGPTGPSPYFGTPIRRVNILPSISQAMLNGVYTWDDEGLHFPGTIAPVDIRLRYDKALYDVTDATSQFLIRGCLDVIADYTAYLAAASRGASQAGLFTQTFEDDMKDLLNLQAHARQYLPGRRKPNNTMRRGWYRGYSTV
jgi:hypothetical protein